MMDRVQDQLPALLALAHDRTEGGRIQLADKLAQIFLSQDIVLNEREEELLNQLIDDLLKAKSVGVRGELVRKFADATRMPRKIALNLASETIDVARNVLINSETLTDEDLISVIETQTRDHAAAIAERKSINEAVADALITTGDVRVMQIVAENLGAKLSTKAIAIIADAARMVTTLHKPIMQRPELTEETATKLCWWVDQDLRRAALQRFGVNAGKLDENLAKTVEEKLAAHALEKDDDDAMTTLAVWLEERNVASAKLLPQVLRLGHFRLFNIMLSRMCKISLTGIDAIVGGDGGRMLAVVCRALGVDKANFVSVFLLSRGARTGDQVVHPRELSQALLAFDRLALETAKDMVHTWSANPDYLMRRSEEVALGA